MNPPSDPSTIPSEAKTGHQLTKKNKTTMLANSPYFRCRNRENYNKIGYLKNIPIYHIAKSLFRENHYPNQQKCRRVPLHLLEKVKQELDKLIKDRQIVRLEKCPDDVFISPVVITAK